MTCNNRQDIFLYVSQPYMTLTAYSYPSYFILEKGIFECLMFKSTLYIMHYLHFIIVWYLFYSFTYCFCRKCHNIVLFYNAIIAIAIAAVDQFLSILNLSAQIMSEPALVLHSQDLIYLLSGISYSASFLLAGD